MAVYAAYAFDEGSGSTITDYSGNGHDMTVFGTNSWVTGHGSYANAFQSGSTESDGAYFHAGSVISALTGDVTIMMWFKHAAASDTNSHAGGLYGSLGFARASIWTYRDLFGTAASPQGTIRDSGGSLFSLGSNGTHSDTSWHHAALVYHSSGLVEIYLDGSQVFSGTPTSNPIGSTVNYIGVGCISSLNDATEGIVQDLRVFDTALTSTDVTTWMNTPVHSSSVSGTADITLKKMTAAVSGIDKDSGTAGATLKKMTVSASGLVKVSATTDAALKKMTASASGSVKLSGTADITLKKITTAVSSIEKDSGTTAATLKKITVAISGNVFSNATVSVTLKKMTVAVIANAPVAGTADVMLKKITVSSSSAVRGTASVTLKKIQVRSSNLPPISTSTLFIFSMR